MALPDVLCCFLTGHSAYYSSSRKDTCYIKHPRTSKNILNKIPFVLCMINASAVRI